MTTGLVEKRRPGAAQRATKLLQEYDKTLIAEWRWEVERWGVCGVDRKGTKYLIYLAQTESGAYRNIDCRDIKILRDADLQRKEKSFSAVNDIMQHNSKMERAQIQGLRNDAWAISKERWRHTMGHPMVASGTSFK